MFGKDDALPCDWVEYCDKLLALVRRRVALYRRFAIETSPEGGLRVRGAVVYVEDIDRLEEADFSEDEMMAYEREATALDAEAAALRRRAWNARLAAERLFARLALTPFERLAVCLALAAELDRRFERLFMFVQDDFNLKRPTLDFCLRCFSLRQRRRLEILRDLPRRAAVFELLFAAPEQEALRGVARPLRLSRRCLGYLFGEEAPSPELGRLFLSPQAPAPPLVQAEIAARLTQRLQAAEDKRIVLLSGAPGSGRRTQARQICARLGKALLLVDCGATEGDALEARLAEAVRESRLQGAWLCFSRAEALLEAPALLAETLRSALQEQDAVFLLAERFWQGEKSGLPGRLEEVSLPELTVAERLLLWRVALAAFPSEAQACALELSGKFHFTPGRICRSATAAQVTAQWEGRAPDRELLHLACRREAQAQVGERAALLPCGYDWDDLVLPEKQRAALRGICGRLRDGGRVFETWGFAAKVNNARGVSALFYGSPGTGKTMAAQVIARALALDLYRVDLSAVLSKYIGETQKNLGSVFAEVERSQGILFFDEADALFGRRTEVKDAHDRYANADTAFLLQRIESYAGIVLLATNYYQNFDEAFKRRLQFVVEFPLPDAPQRLELWRKAFPAAAPLAADADLPWLAERFELSGSNIRNIAVAAAFSTAAQGGEITMAQLLAALRQELQKFGRALHATDLGPYAWLLAEG